MTYINILFFINRKKRCEKYFKILQNYLFSIFFEFSKFFIIAIYNKLIIFKINFVTINTFLSKTINTLKSYYLTFVSVGKSTKEKVVEKFTNGMVFQSFFIYIKQLISFKSKCFFHTDAHYFFFWRETLIKI